MPVPSFVVAGTQKAATTWLYECMNEHPNVYVPTTKELHFFCEQRLCDKSRSGLGMDWYLNQFNCEQPYQATGEFSIDYMYYPDIASKLQTINPSMKVIFILRDPVDRAYSAYWMRRRNRRDCPPFSHYVHEDSEYVSRGFYCRQIERYRAFFPDDQLKILVYEDIAKDPYAFLSNVFRFIGVDPDFRPPSGAQLIAETKQISPLVSMLFYRHASRLLRFPPALWTWRAVKRLTGIKRQHSDSKATSKYLPIPEGDRRRLEVIYRDENELLFALLNRRVAEWQR
jgi:hypothetical protein